MAGARLHLVDAVDGAQVDGIDSQAVESVGGQRGNLAGGERADNPRDQFRFGFVRMDTEYLCRQVLLLSGY